MKGSVVAEMRWGSREAGECRVTSVSRRHRGARSTEQGWPVAPPWPDGPSGIRTYTEAGRALSSRAEAQRGALTWLLTLCEWGMVRAGVWNGAAVNPPSPPESWQPRALGPRTWFLTREMRTRAPSSLAAILKSESSESQRKYFFVTLFDGKM